MQYGGIEGLGKPVSRIILGGSSGDLRRGLNCDEILDFAFSLGINAFDTARGYGKSEKVLGEWINRRALREKVVLITKGALHGLFGNNRVNEKCIRADLKKSLETLGTDYADIYLLHRDNPDKDAGEIVELLNELRGRGLIKVFGVSNWDYKRITAANEYAYKKGLAPFAVSEPHFSLAEAGRWTWIGCTSITGKNHENERAWYKNTQFPLFAFSPLGGGFLSGAVKSGNKKSLKKLPHAMRVTFGSDENFNRLSRLEKLSKETKFTVAQLALAWVLQSGMNTFAVTGSGRIESLKKSAEAAEIKLTSEQRQFIYNF